MMVDRIVRVGERYLCQLYLGQAEEEKRQHADRKCLHVLEFVRGPAKSQSPRGSASRRHDVTLERFVATDAHVACPAGGCPSSRLARYTRGPIGAPERDTPPATTGLEEDDGRDRIVVVDAHAVALSGRAETEATDRADAGRSNVPRHVPLGLREDEKDPQSGRWKLLGVAAGSHRVLSQMQMAKCRQQARRRLMGRVQDPRTEVAIPHQARFRWRAQKRPAKRRLEAWQHCGRCGGTW